MQIDHLQSLLILFGKRAFFEAVAKKKYPQTAVYVGLVALRGPHGDASAHESLQHPDGGKVQKCHSRRWGSPV